MRLESIPVAMRRGFPNPEAETSPWSSMSNGRVPSIQGTTTEPQVFFGRLSSIISEGLDTGINPLRVIRNDDLVGGPKRFLTLRRIRFGVVFLSFKVMSHVLPFALVNVGPVPPQPTPPPALFPSLVTWSTLESPIYSRSWQSASRSPVFTYLAYVPGAEETADLYRVWIEAIMTCPAVLQDYRGDVGYVFPLKKRCSTISHPCSQPAFLVVAPTPPGMFRHFIALSSQHWILEPEWLI